MRRSSCLLALAAVFVTRAPAARERLLGCSNERCPAMLREDCTRWTSEVIAAMPTVVFGARDAAASLLGRF